MKKNKILILVVFLIGLGCLNQVNTVFAQNYGDRTVNDFMGNGEGDYDNEGYDDGYAGDDGYYPNDMMYPPQQMEPAVPVYLDDIAKINKPAIICRSAKCTRLNDRTTASFLYSSLFKLLYYNSNTAVGFCEADPHTRACVTKGIRYGMTIGGGTPAIGNLSKATIFNSQFDKKFRTIATSFQYSMLVNGAYVKCNSVKKRINIKDANTLIFISDDFYCDMASGTTPVGNFIMNIDYIDLDYGLLGGFFSISFMGGANGGKSGYMIMKFENSGNAGIKTRTVSVGSSSDGSGNVDTQGGYVPPGEYKVLPFKSEDKSKKEDKQK